MTSVGSIVVARMHRKNACTQRFRYFARANPVQALTNTVKIVVTTATIAVFRKYRWKSKRDQAVV